MAEKTELLSLIQALNRFLQKGLDLSLKHILKQSTCLYELRAVLGSKNRKSFFCNDFSSPIKEKGLNC